MLQIQILCLLLYILKVNDMQFIRTKSHIITAYGVGRGNAPTHVYCVGHLRAVFSFLKVNKHETHIERSYLRDLCTRI